MTPAKRPAANVVRALHETYWAMLPEKLQVLHEIAARQHAAMTPEMVAREFGTRLEESTTVTVRDGVARLPIRGPLMRYANLFSMISGATSYEIVARDLELAARDPQVHAIVLDIDSPGGAVNGSFELAEQIRAADARKPVYGYASGDVASAAYLLAAATRRVVVSPASLVGSLGVCVSIEDKSAQREAMGIHTVTIVSSQSPKKNVDVRTPEGRSEVQRIVDDLAAVFLETVARYRGVSVETVLADYGAGRVVVGVEALRAGLVDGVAYAEDFHAELANARPTAARPLPPPRRPALTLQQELEMKYTKDSKVRAAGAKAVSVQDGDEGTVEEVRDGGAFYRVRFSGGSFAWLAEEELRDVGEEGDDEDPPATDGAPDEDDEAGEEASPAAAAPAGAPIEAATTGDALRRAAEQERARVLAIQALAMPGEEGLLQACLDDAGCTPEMAARRFREAQASTRNNRLTARLTSEAGKPRAALPVEPAPTGAPSKPVARVIAAIARVFPPTKP